MWLLGTNENEGAAAYSQAFLESQVESPEVREKLRPKDAFGCKRILVLDNWLSMFNQKNVELITQKPVQFTEKGIISEDGIEREVDVILNGTGIPPRTGKLPVANSERIRHDTSGRALSSLRGRWHKSFGALG